MMTRGCVTVGQLRAALAGMDDDTPVTTATLRFDGYLTKVVEVWILEGCLVISGGRETILEDEVDVVGEPLIRV